MAKLFFLAAACALLAVPSSRPSVLAFAPTVTVPSRSEVRRSGPCTGTCRSSSSPPSQLRMIDPSMLSSAFADASMVLATIDSDIASIPDDQFGKVFAGGGVIIFGSVFSTWIVGQIVENTGGGYAELVAETYAKQNYEDENETFLDSLGLKPGERKETEDMILAFREKKKRSAGQWTDEDEMEKQKGLEEKEMFSDYDED